MRTDEHNGQRIREELDRVLASPGFARNERLSRFLRFLVEGHLAGRHEELKESLIGVEVFGRRPDYDPKLDSIVRTEAGRLRARLIEYYARAGSENPVVIEVPKGGYVPVFRTPEGSGRERTGHLTRSRVLTRSGFVAALVVPLVVFAAGWWIARPGSAPPIRIGVLPLENLSADPRHEYFADGLTDEIISNLSVIEGLAVRSRTSSFALKGQSRNVREAGAQLDVDYILEGSIARAADQLRIYAQLVRVGDDVAVWSGRFDRTLTDALAIQEEISQGIVNTLRLQLGRGRRRYETSVEAYDIYLRARALDQQPVPGRFQSIEPFEHAIAKDPLFAPAYAGLASVHAIRSIQFPVDHPANELTTMRGAAERAIQLDPLLAEAHDALGLVYAREGRWEDAERSFRHAIELDRNRSTTYDNFALWLLFVLGRNEEALQQLRLAEQADPLSTSIHSHLGTVQISAGRYDEAASSCLKVAVSDSIRQQCLARARLGQGDIAGAIQLLENAPDLSTNPQARGFLGHVYARAGRRDEAEKLAAVSVYPNEQALIFAGLGDRDRTFAALERMAVLGAQRIGMYLNQPEFSLVRDDPRLPAFRDKVGLPP